MPDESDELLAERSLSLPAEEQRLTELVDTVEAFGFESQSGGRDAWHEFLTAVAEVGANILVYAYRDQAPGQVELTLLRFRDRLEARFRDWGAPFEEPPPSPQPDDPDSLDAILALEESGRGLGIARAALSSVTYQRTPSGENHWRLVKRLP